MTLSKTLAMLICSFCIVSTGCSINQSNGITQGIGYSCFEEPSDAMNRNQTYYLCIFELNRPSPFYSDSNRLDIVNSFLGSLNRQCAVTREWEMIDAKDHVEHAMFFYNYRVQCG